MSFDSRSSFFALQEQQPGNSLLDNLQRCLSVDNPFHVYTGNIAARTQLCLSFVTLVIVGSLTLAELTQRDAGTSNVPINPACVVQELCLQEQNIDHAELLAIIRAQECF